MFKFSFIVFLNYIVANCVNPVRSDASKEFKLLKLASINPERGFTKRNYPLVLLVHRLSHDSLFNFLLHICAVKVSKEKLIHQWEIFFAASWQPDGISGL